MERPPVVSREQLEAAIEEGDLAIIESFFAQPHVRDQVRDTNAYIVETAPTDPARFTRRDGARPWFRRSKTDADDDDIIDAGEVLVLLAAACDGHDHVISWFYSAERVDLMGETLAFLLPCVAQAVERRAWRPRTHRLRTLESLLSSQIFHRFLSDPQKQEVLNRVARYCRVPALAQIAVAHGGEEKSIDGIAEDGLLFAAMAMTDAADQWDDRTLAAVLDGQCVDVDVRDEDGRTTLMRLALVDLTDPESADSSDYLCYVLERDPLPTMALLLQYGDVNLVDKDGRTALHFAAVNNRRAIKLLLASGADPTIRDGGGVTPFERVQSFVVSPPRQQRFRRRVVDPIGTPSAPLY